MTDSSLTEEANARLGRLGLSIPVSVGSPFPASVDFEEYPEDPDFPHSIHPECRFAVDYGVPVGTPIVAVEGGSVILIKDDSTEFGVTIDDAPKANMVCIAHPSGFFSEYIHLGFKEVYVHIGDHVEPGQVIGRTGYSGLMTNEHLHLNLFIMLDDKPVSIPFTIHHDA